MGRPDDRVKLRLFEGPQAVGQLPLLRVLYAEVYAEPPYCEGPADVAEWADSWPAQCERPGHRLVIAYVDGKPAGFVYGHRLPAATGWWSGLLEPVDPDVVREDGTRTFAINELVVREPLRRRGVASAMHNLLLARVDVERVTLLSRPEADSAQATYRAWGYQKVAPLRPYGAAPVYDAMLLPSPGNRAVQGASGIKH